MANLLAAVDRNAHGDACYLANDFGLSGEAKDPSLASGQWVSDNQ